MRVSRRFVVLVLERVGKLKQMVKMVAKEKDEKLSKED